MSGAGRSHRGRRARGPRLVRHRQPAHRAHAEGGRAGRAPRARTTTRSPWSSARAPGSRTRARCSPPLQAADGSVARGVPRRLDRRPGAALREHQAPPPASGGESLAASIERERRLAEAAAGPGRHRHRHHRPQRARRSASGSRSVLETSRRSTTAWPSSVTSFGYKHGLPARRRPGLRLPVPAQPALGRGAAAAAPASTPDVRDYVLAQPRPTPFLDRVERPARPCSCPSTRPRARRT